MVNVEDSNTHNAVAYIKQRNMQEKLKNVKI